LTGLRRPQPCHAHRNGFRKDDAGVPIRDSQYGRHEVQKCARMSVHVCVLPRVQSTCVLVCMLRHLSPLLQSCVRLHGHHEDDANGCRASNQHDHHDVQLRVRNLCRVYGRARHVMYNPYFFSNRHNFSTFIRDW
jgi:hypothetical protein